MSRNIDLTKPLSDEDRAYLEARGRHRDIALADGEDHSNTPDDSITGATDQPPTPTPAATASQNADDGSSTAPDGSADSGDGSVATEPEAEEDNYDDESAWSYEDLKDEVRARKEAGVEGTPALNSSRDDIIEWLREDDANA